MLEGVELGSAIREAIRLKGVTQKDVAAAFQVRQSSVSEWLKHGRVAKKHLNLLVEYFANVVGPSHWGLESVFQIAQQVSPKDVTIVPQRPAAPVIVWRGSNMKELPDLFQVPAPDDSMADRVRQGWLIEFDRRLKPRQGDGVLVEDSEKRWFFRLYSEGTQGRFEALPLNPTYQKLESQRDGLKVLAVLVGVPMRWS